MKKIIYLLLLVFITTPENIKTQVINPLDFFPHHVGDLWQYFTYTQVGSEFTQVEVISVDTSFTDSSMTITKFNGSQEIYFKIFLNDTLTIWQDTPGGWGILYDLGAGINSFWLSDPYSQSFTKYIGESEAIVFDDTVLSREYWVGPDTLFVLPYSEDHLALKIGYYYSEFEVGIIVLNGCIINGVQYGTIISVEDENENSQPLNYVLNNFPNPFNGQTTIHFYLQTASFIILSIYDVLGNEIERLYSGEESEGHHYKIWTPKEVSSGLYFVVMKADNVQLTHKVLLLK